MADSAPPPVVICGAGIIGCATAFHLARRGRASVLIERHEVAGCASGRAGGFLAKTWASNGEWDDFARASFEAHMQLAAQLNDCDYRRLEAVRIVVASAGQQHGVRNEDACDLGLVPPWVDGSVVHASKAGDPSDSAQVHPRKLCRALLQAAKGLADVQVMDGQVTGFVWSDRRVTGVRVLAPGASEPHTVSGAAVVIAMGPWSGQACQWLGLPPLVGGCRGHSVVMRVPDALRSSLTATALFAELVDSEGQELFLEIYPRPDDTIYMCGLMDYQRVPCSVSGVQPSPSSIKMLKEKSVLVSSQLEGCEVLSEQACFMPRTEDDSFLLGPLPGAPGVFIGSGHNYWGILAGPTSGQALAELILDGRCSSFNLSPFDPRRFFASKSKPASCSLPS